MNKVLMNKKLARFVIIDGIEYDFYDFENDKGFQIFGWYPPKELRNTLKTIKTEEEMIKFVNTAIKEGKEVLDCNDNIIESI